MLSENHDGGEEPNHTILGSDRQRFIRLAILSSVFGCSAIISALLHGHISWWVAVAAGVPSIAAIYLAVYALSSRLEPRTTETSSSNMPPLPKTDSESIDRVRALFAAEGSSDGTANALADIALSLTGAQWVWVRNFGNGGAVAKSVKGAPPGWNSDPELNKVIDLCCGRVFISSKPDIVADTKELKAAGEHGKQIKLGARSILTLPLLTDLGVEGFIIAASDQPNAFNETIIESLLVVAEFAAVALSRVSMKEQIESLKHERTDALDDLLESEQRFRATISAMRDGMIIRGRDGAILNSNISASKILGFSISKLFTGDDQGEWMLVDEDRFDFDLSKMPDKVALETGEEQPDLTVGIEWANGNVTWLLLSAAPVFLLGQKEAYASVLTFSDITGRKQSFDANARLAAIVDSSQDAIVCATLDGIVVSWNRGAHKLFGYTPEEAIGLVSPILLPPNDTKSFKNIVRQLTAGEINDGIECIRFRRDGVPVHVSMTYSLVRDSAGTAIAIAAIARDVTDRVRYEDQIKTQLNQINEINGELQNQQDELVQANERLATLATMDGLTSLKNHRFFQERLHEEVVRSQRYGGPLSVFILDVDSFKDYNDTHGHPAGDEVLRIVGQLLTTNCRSSDIVSRYGGEEFVVILPQTPADGALVIAERCRQVIEHYDWPLRSVTASFGVSTLADNANSAAELISAGDKAMYVSKHSGKNLVTHASDLPATKKPLKKAA